MSNDHFEKRMEFLKKSYERIPSTFDPEEVFKKIDAEHPPAPVEQKPVKKGGFRQRITVLAVSVASVFIIGFIANDVLDGNNQNPNEENLESGEIDAFIEELKQQFEVEKEKRREMLQLDEEHFEMYSVSSGIAMLDRKDFVETLKQDGNAKQRFLEVYNRAVEELKTPAEMIQDVKRNPLREDEEASIAFLNSYREKVKRLQTIYDQIIEENKTAIDAYEVDPSADKADVMMTSKNSFPEPLQNIINTMKEQSIRLTTEKYTGNIKSSFYLSRSVDELPSNLHHFTNAYMNMLADEPYLYAGVLNDTVPKTVGTLQTMEETLMHVQEDPSLYPVMKSYFITLFNHIVKGNEKTKLFDADGRLLPEYQEAWTNLSYSGNATPLTYIMRPIVKEMKASDWQQSEHWDSLNYNDLEEALVLYREGVLEEYMYGEMPVFEEKTVVLPNEAFDQEVKELYSAFKKSYDKSVLKGISPVHIVGIFNYANEVEDPKTMYRLFNENYGDMSETGFSEEQYIDFYRKGLSLFRNATDIKFTNENINRYEHAIYGFVTINNGAEVKNSVHLTYGEDDVWKIRDMYLEKLPSYEQSPEIPIDEMTHKHMKELYETFKESKNPANLYGEVALTIMSLYLYAGSLQDYETQYALIYQEFGADLIEKSAFVENGDRYKFPYAEDMYTSMSFKGLEEDQDGNWPGVATFTINQEKYPKLPAAQQFHMLWTDDGWRVNVNHLK